MPDWPEIGAHVSWNALSALEMEGQPSSASMARETKRPCATISFEEQISERLQGIWLPKKFT